MSNSLQPVLALLGYAVAGNPTQYMIEKAFAQRELDWRYLSLEVAPEKLADAVRGMKAMGFAGGNCAEPHKAAIGPLLDRVGQAAELSGLVNCFHNADGRLVGENTEGRALVESLRLRTDPEGKRVMLFGAGDLARAAAVELGLAKAAGIMVADPEEENARALARLLADRLAFDATAVPWEPPFSLPLETHIAINTTQIGGAEMNDEFPLDMETLKPEMFVIDSVLSPPETWLVREAEQRGCTTIDGLEIFIAQMAINVRLWTGVDADTGVLREAVEEFLEL